MKASKVLSMVVMGALALVMLSGCYFAGGATLVGSGRTSTRNMDLAGFTGIDASSAFQLDVVQGPNYSVAVTVDDNLMDRVDVYVSGSTLHIGMKPGSFSTRSMQRAQVTMPSLASLTLSGASRATVSGFKSTADFKSDLSGASRVEGDLDAANATVQLSGASNAQLRGTVTSLRVDASGASNANLVNYSAQKADITLSGASKADVTVSSTLDYDLSGASNLSFSGDPKIGRMQSSGASRAVRH